MSLPEERAIVATQYCKKCGDVIRIQINLNTEFCSENCKEDKRGRQAIATL